MNFWVTVLVVYSVANLLVYALQSGSKLIIINLAPTHLDARADVVLLGKAREVLQAVLAETK